MSPSPHPELFIVGGPNGSGKTTIALRYLRHKNLAFLNADTIAAKLCPLEPARAAIAAGKEFSWKLRNAIERGDSLLVESTLSGLTLQQSIQRASDVGYHITIAFVYVASPRECISRIKERVAQGGHFIPDADVVRRFPRCLSNFWNTYRELASEWVLFYNGGASLAQVASGLQWDVSIVDDKELANFLHSAGMEGVYNRLVMTKVFEESELRAGHQNGAERLADHLRWVAEIERIAKEAVREAQEENRRLGIPNYYWINGGIVSDQDGGVDIPK